MGTHLLLIGVSSAPVRPAAARAALNLRVVKVNAGACRATGDLVIWITKKNRTATANLALSNEDGVCDPFIVRYR
jgi:hypothetical protein